MGLIDLWTVTNWGRDIGENSSIQAVEVSRLQTTFAESCGVVIERMLAIEGLAAKLVWAPWPAQARLAAIKPSRTASSNATPAYGPAAR
ncbi:hypothetical protein [Pseudotabrizicola sp. 4114]|uniref:hypothetical protein n=1 Tax=Pseudotabrizicola sp. 4114 TaxID=2817731 RepID=UPI0028595B83|nr:hypothetical protein [Pseudorhodobacter sp. 4114]